MPIYEYLCKKCGEFEIMQRITENALRRCPTCHGKVTKLISNTSFQLKGNGWYVTDYARKDSPAKDSASKDSATKDAPQDSASKTSSAAEKGDTSASGKSASKAGSKEVAAA
jgi:putative FmdB family regulatory protein